MKAVKKKPKIVSSNTQEALDILDLAIKKHKNLGYFSNIYFSDEDLFKIFNISKSTFYNNRVNILKELEIIEVVKDPSYKNEKATEFMIYKDDFLIWYSIINIFNSLEQKHKKMLQYHKCEINPVKLFKKIKKTIKNNLPLPFHQSKLVSTRASSLENYIINSFYRLFFIGINNFISFNMSKIGSTNKNYFTQLHRYSINNGSLVQVLDAYKLTDYTYNSFVFSFFSLTGSSFWEKKITCLSHIWIVNNFDEKLPEKVINDEKYQFSIDYIVGNSKNTIHIPNEITDKFTNHSDFYLKPLRLYGKEITEYLTDEKTRWSLAEAFVMYNYNNSPLIKYLIDLTMKNHLLGSEIRSTLKVSIEPISDECGELIGYELKLTTRAYSNFGKEEKRLRNKLLISNWGDSDSYDFSSCSYNLVRVLNKGKFSTTWSLKDKIVSKNIPIEYKKGETLKRSELKTLNYIVFNKKTSDYEDIKSIQTAINADRVEKLKNPYHIREYPDLSEESLITIIDLIYEECGDWTVYKDNIFFLESIVELSIRLEMFKRGLNYENIYDCHFFNPNQISRKDFLSLIKAVMNDFDKKMIEFNPFLKYKRKAKIVKLSDDEKNRATIYILMNLAWSRYPKNYSDFIMKNAPLNLKFFSPEEVEMESLILKKYRDFYRSKGIIYGHYNHIKKITTYSIYWSELSDTLIELLDEKIIKKTDIDYYLKRILTYQSNSLEVYEIEIIKKVLDYEVKYEDLVEIHSSNNFSGFSGVIEENVF